MLTKKKEIKFKINGLIGVPRWKSIPCICHATDITKQYPLTDCLNCKFSECEKSMPRKEFISDGQKINEITIVRGSKYQDIIAFTWSTK
tara:strand:+ start:497 stop:763 length:267 start_codon:yes stop_codon:yes gene_type:complete